MKKLFLFLLVVNFLNYGYAVAAPASCSQASSANLPTSVKTSADRITALSVQSASTDSTTIRADYDLLITKLSNLVPTVAHEEDMKIPVTGGSSIDGSPAVPAGSITIRLYYPGRTYVTANSHPNYLPAIVYVHGGAWMMGDLHSHDGVVRALADSSGSPVISVNYRLAPEYPFPTALYDTYNALKWVEDNATTMGFDPNKIGLVGDSAGANLVASMPYLLDAAQRMNLPAVPKIAFMGLFYPATDLSFHNNTDLSRNTDSWSRFANGPVLTSAMVSADVSSIYTSGSWGTTARATPFASPLLAAPSPSQPANTTVILAACDPLYSEGAALGQRLGAKVLSYETVHGFAQITNTRDTALAPIAAFAADAVGKMGTDFRNAVGGGAAAGNIAP